jgi:adhesin transport system membrane fusion protein
MVKLTAFDFNRYGGLEGMLEHISPDTMKDENKNRKPGSNPVDLEEGFYRILVRITDQNLERNGRTLIVQPGMTASIEIKTGQKTILTYLLRPLQAVSESLRER